MYISNLLQLLIGLIFFRHTYSAFCTYCVEDDPICHNFGFRTIDTFRGENKIKELDVDGDGMFLEKNLSDCLPKMYKLIKLRSAICFWSKELGCTIVAPERNIKQKVVKKCDKCIKLSGCNKTKQLTTSDCNDELCLNKLLIGLAIIIINKV
ncbi:uncharacterized protein LOC111519078 [Drosophila willistoni]|uniref:uncharacterized protein LOC111519078 n=1 Tax=Drosophila willistoni TaxID=7260 RepID=UPI001F07DC72|nr:uncharacterized protein LOC111519078 [Drosophila willistoni]